MEIRYTRTRALLKKVRKCKKNLSNYRRFRSTCTRVNSWLFSVLGDTVTVSDDSSQQSSSQSRDLSVYRVGNASRCIVWNYDIFGFNGGRTREIADLMATKGICLPFYDQASKLKGSIGRESLPVNEAVYFEAVGLSGKNIKRK